MCNSKKFDVYGKLQSTEGHEARLLWVEPNTAYIAMKNLSSEKWTTINEIHRHSGVSLTGQYSIINIPVKTTAWVCFNKLGEFLYLRSGPMKDKSRVIETAACVRVEYEQGQFDE